MKITAYNGKKIRLSAPTGTTFIVQGMEGNFIIGMVKGNGNADFYLKSPSKGILLAISDWVVVDGAAYNTAIPVERDQVETEFMLVHGFKYPAKIQ